MRHQITIHPHWQGHGVYVRCSCWLSVLARVGDVSTPASLDEITRIAHQHIEAAERAEFFRTQPAVTSPSQLVDIRAKNQT